MIEQLVKQFNFLEMKGLQEVSELHKLYQSETEFWVKWFLADFERMLGDLKFQIGETQKREMTIEQFLKEQKYLLKKEV